MKPVEYMEMISSLRPNIWATLADEVPTWVSDKRNKTSVDRTVRWMDECIALGPVRSIHFFFLVSFYIVIRNPYSNIMNDCFKIFVLLILSQKALFEILNETLIQQYHVVSKSSNLKIFRS